MPLSVPGLILSMDPLAKRFFPIDSRGFKW